jgi:hypothetical protein
MLIVNYCRSSRRSQVMTSRIDMLTMWYMELSMMLVAVVSLLDWVIYTIKMSLVLYVDVEESLLFS